MRARRKVREGDRIEMHDGQVRFFLDNQALDTFDREDLRALYRVTLLMAFDPEEESFHVAVFDRCLWVIPRFCQGSAQLFESWRAHLRTSTPFYTATLLRLPTAWRERWLGFLPVSPLPRLHRQPDVTLPGWESLEGPMHYPA